MKKNFTQPILQVLQVSASDIISTSVGLGNQTVDGGNKNSFAPERFLEEEDW